MSVSFGVLAYNVLSMPIYIISAIYYILEYAGTIPEEHRKIEYNEV